MRPNESMTSPVSVAACRGNDQLQCAGSLPSGDDAVELNLPADQRGGLRDVAGGHAAQHVPQQPGLLDRLLDL
jgi:hypothetical protein